MTYAKVLGVFVVLLAAMPVATHAASFEFGSTTGPVHVGDTIQVPVFIDPRQASTSTAQETVSVVSADLRFSQDRLWAKSFTFGPNWVPIEERGYDLIDNAQGTLLKTGGFRGGVTERTLLGTIDLIATRDGEAALQTGSSSLMLDLHNNDVLEKKTAEQLVVVQASTTRLPSQLFDIRLGLERTTISSSSDLVAQATFTSFGQVATPVDLEFLIVDGNGRVFGDVHDSLVVETEGVITERFNELVLPTGNYVLHLHTRYRGTVEDDFHTPFTVVSVALPWWVFGVVAVMLGVILTVVLLFMQRRKKLVPNVSRVLTPPSSNPPK